MSTAVTTSEPLASARVYCEPFVYTSMVTKFGTANDYRMVAAGEKLTRQASDAVSEMSQRMVVLTKAVDSRHELFAYFCTGGGVPLVVFLRCTANLDWQGRPGGYCSGVAFRRDELGQLPGANVHALDFSTIPFLAQDQVESFLNSAGEKAKDGLVLKGLHVKAAPAYFRTGDRQNLASHLSEYMALACRIESGELIHARQDEDAWRTLRLVSLLLPARLRAETSALLGARRGLERVARVQLWLENDQSGAGVANLLSTASGAEFDRDFSSYLANALSDPEISDEQILTLLDPDPAIATVKEFWADVRQAQQRQELACSRTLGGRSAADAAAIFASLIRRAANPAGMISERLEVWQNEPDLLAACLQVLRVSHVEIYNLVVGAMGETMKTDSSTRLRALLAQTAIWRTTMLRDFWLRVWANATLPAPDEAMIVRLLELDEKTCAEWLERWVPQHPGAFLQSPAFKSSPRWRHLSVETRKLMYRACLEAADPSVREFAVQSEALNEFIEPADLEYLDGKAFALKANLFVKGFRSRRTLDQLLVLWQSAAARPGFEELAQHALWVLVDAIPNLSNDGRATVLRAVCENSKDRSGPISLLGRAERALALMREQDPVAYRAARRELFGEESVVESAHALVEQRPARREPISVPRLSIGRHKKWIPAVAALVGVLACGVGAWLMLRPDSAPHPYLAEKEFEQYERERRKSP